MSQGEDYEVRTYEVTNWVSTTLTGMELDPAMNAGFRRLFKYIQGENERSKRLVLYLIVLSDDLGLKVNSLLLPSV